jgi:hypothetical protein
MTPDRDDAPLTPVERALVRAIVAALLRQTAPAAAEVACR